MTLMKSGCLTNAFPTAGFEPVGWGQGDGVFGQHAGQTGENVGEVFFRMDSQTTEVS